jgi:transcriptional regulator with XRE-family HTH domain
MGWRTEPLFEEAARAGLNQEQLAARMRIAASNLSRVKRGKQGPGMKFRLGARFAFPLHDVDRLVYWEPDEPTPNEAEEAAG